MEQLQAVVDGLSSPQHAAQVNAVLTVMPGVLMSRLDHNTSNLFMHLAPGAHMDAAILGAALAPFGLTVRCCKRGETTGGKFHHLDPQACGEAPAHAR